MVHFKGDVGETVVLSAFVQGQVICVIYAVFSNIVGSGLGLPFSERGEVGSEVTRKGFY